MSRPLMVWMSVPASLVPLTTVSTSSCRLALAAKHRSSNPLASVPPSTRPGLAMKAARHSLPITTVGSFFGMLATMLCVTRVVGVPHENPVAGTVPSGRTLSSKPWKNPRLCRMMIQRTHCLAIEGRLPSSIIPSRFLHNSPLSWNLGCVTTGSPLSSRTVRSLPCLSGAFL